MHFKPCGLIPADRRSVQSFCSILLFCITWRASSNRDRTGGYVATAAIADPVSQSIFSLLVSTIPLTFR